MKKMIVAAVLAVLALCIFSSGCIDTSLYPETNQGMADTLNSISDDIKIQCDDISEAMIKKASVLSHLKKFGSEFNTEIERFYDEVPEFVAAVYYDYESEKLYGYPDYYTYKFDFGSHKISEKGSVQLISVYNAKLRGPMFIIGTPVYDEKGKLIGGLYCSFESYLIPSKITSRYAEAEGYYLTIDYDDRIIYYHPSPELIGEKAKYKASDVKEESGSYSYINEDNEMVSAVYKRENIFGEDMVLSLNVRDNQGYDLSSIIYSMNVSQEEMTEALRSVYTYAQVNSKTGLMKYVNRLTDSKYPIYVVTDGVVVASNDESFINRDMNADLDAYNVPETKLEMITSDLGGGYLISMMRVNAEHALYKAVPALVYILNIDRDTYIKTYMPLYDDAVDIYLEKAYAVNKAGNDALIYRMKYGEAEMFKAITNHEIGYSDEIEAAAISFDGIILANSMRPDLVGTDAFSIVDAIGISLSRNIVNLADNGAGNMYYAYHDEKTDKDIIYICTIDVVSDSAIVFTMLPIQKI